MARAKRKPWRAIKDWDQREWVPMKKAWSRIDGALGEQWELTKRIIKNDLVSRRLVGAARIIAADEKTERCILLARKFWEPIQIGYAWLVTGWEEHRREGEKWYFFVHRRELDLRYPAQGWDEKQERHSFAPGQDAGQEPQAETQPPPSRRRPGPPPKNDWPTRVTRELIRRARAGERNPTAPEMLQWCEDMWDWQPDIRQMQNLLRVLLG
jgi:hypothetical protein